MLSSLSGSTLGVWVSRRRKIQLGEETTTLLLNMVISKSRGSDFNTAMLCDTTGRHLVMMPQAFDFSMEGRIQRIENEVSPLACRNF
jgi:phosphoribosylformylglycinamidine synthase